MKYPFSGIIVRYIRSTATLGPADPTPNDELHINLWEIERRRFIDIGVLINRPSEISELQVDLPWIVDRTKVHDLGSRLVGERIVAAIFNEVVRYSGSNDETFATVTFPSVVNARNFVLARLSSNDFSTEQVVLSDGSVTGRLKVRVPSLEYHPDAPDRLYIRFRITEIPEDNYTSTFPQKDRNLLSSSVETRILDFRVNVRRGIPDDVLTSQTNLRFPGWRKIHFFMTLDRTREMTFNNERFVDCRSLEDEAIWNDYVGLDNTTSNKCSVTEYLGYQWTSKSKDGIAAKDLVALARFSEVKSSKGYVIRFILLALILGAMGNGIWDVTSNGLMPPYSEESKNVFNTLFILTIAFFATIFLPPLTSSMLKFMVRIWRKFLGWLHHLFI